MSVVFPFLIGLWLGALLGFGLGVAPKVRGVLRHVVCPAIAPR